MSNIVVTKSHLRSLLAAAHNIQTLMNDGTLTAAWGDGQPDDINEAVSAFDALTDRAARLASEDKNASPFLRYRREIMASPCPKGERLRKLVLNLYGGIEPVSLRRMAEYGDEHHRRIILECIASFFNEGDRDSHFMGLAMEIAEAEQEAASEVAA